MWYQYDNGVCSMNTDYVLKFIRRELQSVNIKHTRLLPRRICNYNIVRPLLESENILIFPEFLIENSTEQNILSTILSRVNVQVQKSKEGCQTIEICICWWLGQGTWNFVALQPSTTWCWNVVSSPHAPPRRNPFLAGPSGSEAYFSGRI